MFRKSLILALVVILLLILAALFSVRQDDKEMIGVEIKNSRVAAQLAYTPEARTRGLSGRENLSPGEGMLFWFPETGNYAIWMKDMKFPIDVIWFRDGKVVDLEENLPVPDTGASISSLPRFIPDVPANFILEVQAGFIKANDVKIGDPVLILSPEKIPSSPNEGNLSIESLRAKIPNGKDLNLEKIGDQKDYSIFSFSFKSDGEELHGLATLPPSAVPEESLPVLIFDSGEISSTTSQAQDFFAKNGYATLSLGGEQTRSYINLLDAVRKFKGKIFDQDQIGFWEESRTGAGEQLAVLPVPIRAFVFLGPANSQNDFQNYLPGITSPIQVHNQAEEKIAGISWKNIADDLEKQNKKIEIFEYPQDPVKSLSLVLQRALQFFDSFVKN